MDLAETIRLACVIEATARKPGNVHPAAAFADLSYGDFVRAAAAGASALAQAGEIGVGRAVLECVERTRAATGTNVNLGIALLIAPLAAVPPEKPISDGIEAVLDSLTLEDADFVYRAIRVAQAGGLGRVDDEDVSGAPTRPLREIMALAAGRDAIAAEYARGFPLVLGIGLPYLAGRSVALSEVHRAIEADMTISRNPGDCPFTDWEEAVIGLHLLLMAIRPDTLIARKCGIDVARESAARAARVLEAGWPETPAGREEFDRLDAWLRADGNRRNPGTTADLVAASLFAALREGAA